MQTKPDQSNLRLFELTKDVKSYDENFFEIVEIILGWICCPHCGSSFITLWSVYPRKKAKILIQRFKCKKCKRTFNWLPPFLLPRKHYTILEMEPGIESYVTSSKGYLKVWQDSGVPCRCWQTLYRWVNTFASMASHLFRTARRALSELKPNFKFGRDKRLFSSQFPMPRSGQVQSADHGLNLLSQLYILREYFVSVVKPKYFLVWLIFVTRLEGSKKPVSTRFKSEEGKQIRNNSPG